MESDRVVLKHEPEEPSSKLVGKDSVKLSLVSAKLQVPLNGAIIPQRGPHKKTKHDNGITKGTPITAKGTTAGVHSSIVPESADLDVDLSEITIQFDDEVQTLYVGPVEIREEENRATQAATAKGAKKNHSNFMLLKQETTDSSPGSDSGIENCVDECAEKNQQTESNQDDSISISNAKPSTPEAVPVLLNGRNSDDSLKTNGVDDEKSKAKEPEPGAIECASDTPDETTSEDPSLGKPNVTESPKSQRRFNCAQCKMSFKTELWYSKHLATVHKANPLLTVEPRPIPSIEPLIDESSASVDSHRNETDKPETPVPTVVVVEVALETIEKEKTVDEMDHKPGIAVDRSVSTNLIGANNTKMTVRKRKKRKSIDSAEDKADANKKNYKNEEATATVGEKVPEPATADKTDLPFITNRLQLEKDDRIKSPPVEDEAYEVVETNGHRRYRCGICGVTFTKRYSIAPHVRRVHNKQKQKTCPFCPLKFTCTGDLTRHVRIHTGSKPFKCSFPDCKFAFISSGDLRKHLRRHTKDIDPIPRPHVCGICAKDFDRPYDLKRHMARHNLNDPTFECITCTVCGKKFCRQDQYRAHSFRHLGYKPHKCEHCGRCFTDASNCAKHVKQHAIGALKQDALICDLCGKPFKNKISISKHLMRCLKDREIKPDRMTVAVKE